MRHTRHLLEGEFNSWFKRTEWWHENTCRERLWPVWLQLRERLDKPSTELAFDVVIGTIRNEYGD